MNKDSSIFVAGHNGLVGYAIMRELIRQGYNNLYTMRRSELDLTDSKDVAMYFKHFRPEYVFLAAAKVGGIQGNMESPVEMMLENLKIQNSVLEAAHRFGTRKLLFLGSSCIYPKFCLQPIKEEYLLTSALEPSNECYALAKISGLKLCQAYRKEYGHDFVSVMPTNLYGIGDRYTPGCHVIPDLIRKFHQFKYTIHETTDGIRPSVRIWGDGTARREFLYSDDLAAACVLVMQQYSDYDPINIGYGTDITVKELAYAVADTVGLKYEQVGFDPTGPVGTPVKYVDSSKIFGLGWGPKVDLEAGLKMAYADFLARYINGYRP